MKRFLPLIVCLAVLPLTLLADSRSIRENVFAAVDRNPEFGRYEISIDVRQGLVTLEGEVATEESKRFVEDVARAEKGVKEVRNFISINPTFSASGVSSEQDKQLAQNVLSALRRDSLLTAGSFEIHAARGKVTLKGTVPQPSAITRAASIAQGVAGVQSVENQLKIAAAISDDEIANQFQAALRKNGIDSGNLQVSVENGEVTLAGDAESFREIDRLLSIALMTPGVLNVRSEMTVRGAPYSTQHWKN